MAASTLNARQVRAIAAEGWIYGYPILENYRTMYPQAIDATDHRYVGGFGTFRHYHEPFTPSNTDIVTPNNDTPYSWAWFDLRAEPWVISVPEIDRYYILPFHDMDTDYVGYIGARTTGQGPGDYLLAGPRYAGPIPAGLKQVLRADTDFVGCVGRTYLANAADSAALYNIQQQYRLRPLHDFAGASAPQPAPTITWPAWNESQLFEPQFFELLDFLLQFFPVLDNEAELRQRLASFGVAGTGAASFSVADLTDEMTSAIRAGIADARSKLDAALAHAANSAGWFGTRSEHGSDYLTKAVGVNKGIYGLPSAEAWYAGWLQDDAGNRPPDAAKHRYTIHFPAGQLPPAQFFWSATMYRLPERLLVANPLDRYSIGDRSPGLTYNDDGGLTLYVQHDAPDDPQQTANWLPAPKGPFTVAVRVYGGKPALVDGSWHLPELTVAE